MTYPLFIRKRVILYIEAGESKASASRKFNISLDTIHRWWINREDISPKRKRVSKSHKLDRDHLIRLIEANPDMMLKEFSLELNMSIHAVWHTLKVLGYSRKKNGSLQRA